MSRTKSNTPTVAEQATNQLEGQESFTINEVLAMTGLSNVYVRKAIKSGKLVTTMGTVPGTKTPRNQISREALEAWRAGISGSKRSDGRNKFVAYLSPEEVEKLMTLIAGEPFAALITRANLKAETATE
jgi:hypothetical protein